MTITVSDGIGSLPPKPTVACRDSGILGVSPARSKLTIQPGDRQAMWKHVSRLPRIDPRRI
jgi:hypothetical protein